MTNSQLDTINESQEVSPIPAGDHNAHINRRTQRHSKHKIEKNIKRSTNIVPPLSPLIPTKIFPFWVPKNFVNKTWRHCHSWPEWSTSQTFHYFLSNFVFFFVCFLIATQFKWSTFQTFLIFIKFCIRFVCLSSCYSILVIHLPDIPYFYKILYFVFLFFLLLLNLSDPSTRYFIIFYQDLYIFLFVFLLATQFMWSIYHTFHYFNQILYYVCLFFLLLLNLSDQPTRHYLFLSIFSIVFVCFFLLSTQLKWSTYQIFLIFTKFCNLFV